MKTYIRSTVHMLGTEHRVEVAVNQGVHDPDQAGFLFVGVDGIDCVLYLSPAGARALVDALTPHLPAVEVESGFALSAEEAPADLSEAHDYATEGAL